MHPGFTLSATASRYSRASGRIGRRCRPCYEAALETTP
jgi:hypothetical protein